ncbi:hypothetical protein VPH29_04350 [Tsukamurella tyrosinosolvens]|uniref:DUF7373 family lipoprotein n=1 Tax=Tsukamurella tyrosinosolvens TaxID=57704 RepID=UPI002DD4471C|nr:hypothetical protein [Tsukamurella tyrosinosolvens]MEC4612415.1 hypothetical protein [Tsukamurella tyrosinosolvens]
MIATLPLISDIDPIFAFGGGGAREYRDNFESRFSGQLGSVPARRIAAAEISAEVRGTSAYWGSAVRSSEVGVVLFRMPSEKAAADAVAPALLERDRAWDGQQTEEKVPVDIPGKTGVVAYTKTGKYTGTNIYAFAAVKRFVLVIIGDFEADGVRKYVDATAAAFADFTPTPIDRLKDLAVDGYDLARLTLKPDAGNGGMSDSVRAILPVRYDVVGSKKYFDDAGVDAAGAGASVVYRARDEAGAGRLAKAMVAEVRANRPGVQSEGVVGVPGADCLTYTAVTTTETVCVAPVGRYVAEYISRQKQRALQAIGASYLILRDVR